MTSFQSWVKVILMKKITNKKLTKNIQMVENTLENLKMERDMDKELLLWQMEAKKLANLKMATL